MLITEPEIFNESGQASKLKFRFRQLVQFFFKTNLTLALFGIMMLLALAGSLLGRVVDPRTLQGVSIWNKPIKFSISVPLYTFTLIWLLSYIKGHPRLVKVISWTTAIALFVDVTIIFIQVLRGVSSHFNKATPFDQTMLSTMGAFIMVFWLVNLVAAVLLLLQRFDNPAFAWALRLGLFLALAGAMLGFLMTTQQTPEQQLMLAAGEKLTAAGGHSVGVNDGGPGLPFVGWSTVGGDLRIGHFIGLHALQILPLIGWLIVRITRDGFSQGHRVLLVWLAGLGYAGLVSIFTWQALRGQSVIAPDALTLGSFAGLVAGTGLLAGGVVLHATLTSNRRPAG